MFCALQYVLSLERHWQREATSWSGARRYTMPRIGRFCAQTQRNSASKQERKKERKKGELKSALKGTDKGPGKIFFIGTNAVSFLKSTFSLWPDGFFRLKEIVKIRSSNKEMHENISKKSKKDRLT